MNISEWILAFILSLAGACGGTYIGRFIYDKIKKPSVDEALKAIIENQPVWVYKKVITKKRGKK